MILLDICEPFFECMRKSVELDLDTIKLIAAHANHTGFRSKQFILAEEGISNKIYIVISGKVRSYYTDF